VSLGTKGGDIEGVQNCTQCPPQCPPNFQSHVPRDIETDLNTVIIPYTYRVGGQAMSLGTNKQGGRETRGTTPYRGVPNVPPRDF